MKHIATFNRTWASVVLTALTRYGVKHICIAPGSRSTPLTLQALALQMQGLVECHSHFDERGLGFFALGIAKSTHTPVAVIVTSGTAVANLLPAVIEASLTHHKLIVLSADRPPELIGCGVNQAIEQPGIFGNYPIASLNLPKPSEGVSSNWLVSAVEQVCGKQAQKGGVVHINAPFEEPLYEADEQAIYNQPWLTPISRWLHQPQAKWLAQHLIQPEPMTHANWEYWRTKRGIVIIGQIPHDQGVGLAQWAETLGWCAISDVQSGVGSTLPYADLCLSHSHVQQKLLQADIVIQFGTQLVSKRVNQFLEAFKGEFWLVDEYDRYINPYSHPQTRFVCNVQQFLRMHPPLPQKEWQEDAKALSNFCPQIIALHLASNMNEASLAHYLERILLPNCNLFLGNSLFIRLVDAFWDVPARQAVYTNRGASGIDGLIATIAGISKGSHLPTVAVIGDISALHDLNSLALLKQLNQPTVLLVVNNNGGAIFDMLPVDPQVKEKFYRLSHTLEFSQIAMMFGFEYSRPYTWADLTMRVKQAYSRRGVTIVEIKVNEHDGSNIYKSVLEKASRTLFE